MPESALIPTGETAIHAQAEQDGPPARPQRAAIHAYPLAAEATRAVVRASLGGRPEQFQAWLREGQLRTVLAVVEQLPNALADLLPILANPAAEMAARLGAQAVFERQTNTAALRALVPALGRLSGHDDHRVRADACHVLGLSGAAEAAPWLLARLDDPDPEVGEIAADSLHRLNSSTTREVQP